VSVVFLSNRGGATGGTKEAASGFNLETSQYMGIDAVKKLRLHYNINKVIVFPRLESPDSRNHTIATAALPLPLHYPVLHLLLLLPLLETKLATAALSSSPLSSPSPPHSPALQHHLFSIWFLFTAGNSQGSRVTTTDNHSEGIVESVQSGHPCGTRILTL